VADGEAEAEWCEEIAACLCRIADGAENAFNDNLLHLVIQIHSLPRQARDKQNINTSGKSKKMKDNMFLCACRD
jgi:hypothetical protein